MMYATTLVKRLAESSGQVYVNLPDSKIRLNNGSLHVRICWPIDKNETYLMNDEQLPVGSSSGVRGLVMFLHGYNAHCNRPVAAWLTDALNEAQFGCLMVDMPGHGFSTGSRAYLESVDSLVDAAEYALRWVAGHGSGNDPVVPGGALPADVPVFIMGHSMGGGLAILTAQRILNNRANPSKVRLPPLGGLILIAPAAGAAHAPGGVVRMLLDNVLSPVLGWAQVPDWLQSAPLDHRVTWDDEDYIASGLRDQEVGFSWSGRMYFRSASVLLNLMERASAVGRGELLRDIAVLAIHDPADLVCPFASSEGIVLVNRHPSSALVVATNGLHDPIKNAKDHYFPRIISFLNSIS